MGGSTNSEGRVEVCIDGRWGTVCSDHQEQTAGAVCSQLGFPVGGMHNNIMTNTMFEISLYTQMP